MKHVLAICMLVLPFLLFAQDEERSLNVGTTFHYTIKEGKVAYKLTAVIKRWDWDTIQFQWQTTAPKVAKGTITMNFGAIGESNVMKIKPKAGKVVLPKDVCGWILPYDVFDSLVNRQLITNTMVDGKNVKLKPAKAEESYPLKYNATIQNVFYGEAADDRQKVKLSFIEFWNDIIFIAQYTNGNYSMTLEKVTNPKKKDSD